MRVLCDIRIMDTHTINLELWGRGGGGGGPRASRSSRICSTEAARSDTYQHELPSSHKKKPFRADGIPTTAAPTRRDNGTSSSARPRVAAAAPPWLSASLPPPRPRTRQGAQPLQWQGPWPGNLPRRSRRVSDEEAKTTTCRNRAATTGAASAAGAGRPSTRG